MFRLIACWHLMGGEHNWGKKPHGAALCMAWEPAITAQPCSAPRRARYGAARFASPTTGAHAARWTTHGDPWAPDPRVVH